MKYKNALLYIIICSLSVCFAAGSWTINSPDGKVAMTILLNDNGQLSYCAYKESTMAMDTSRIGITTAVENFDNGGLVFSVKIDSIVDETYSLPLGKKTVYVNKANQMTLKFLKNSHELDVAARAYDDGVAYRLAMPGTGSASISAEDGTFKVPANTTGWIMILNTNYWYEEYYDPRSYANISDPNAQFFMPALLSTPGGLYVLVSESGVDGTYTGSHLKGGTNGILHLAWEDKATSPYANPCVQTVPLSTPYPAVLPWRVCIIASNLNDLVNSTLIDNLSGQSEVSDVSWIKGGLSSWDWGSGLSQSLSTGKMLVDYSASMQWAFTLIDGNTPSYLGDLIAYAQPKGVGIWTWKASDGFGYSASTITQQLQSWKNLGVTGIKIDFFDNDCQQKMGLYFDIAREAAKDHLLVNFHGARAPTGWERRFPNVLSSEGIHGAEYNLHASLVYKNKCEHNCTVPFTRNVVGPMDYTPVSIHLNGGTTTYAHQMALPIIFESHIQHIAEQPSVLQGLPANAQEILRALPAGWDELKLLEGNVGNFLTMARRKGSIWYVGAISTPARTAVIPLSFLGNVKYLATIYKDGSSITSIVKTVDTVTQATTLSIPLLKTGGCAIKLQNLAPVSTDKNNVAPIASSSMNSRISMTMTIDKPIVMPSNARGFILYDVQGRQLWRYERGNGADKETIKILGKFRTQGALIVHFDFK